MDSTKALVFEGLLKGQSIRGWQIGPLINHGKSAAVFKGTKDGAIAAVKIFDDELIERYGDKVQLARIDRELKLIGLTHPNMVNILDGGFDAVTKNHFIIMEYLSGPNLRECLHDVAAEDIQSLITQLASAAEFLEKHELVHRDIKPENIILLDNFKKLVLLDFGVLRPIGKPGLTDGTGLKSFIGTLQYSSPEFLLRKEEDNIAGWRALTIYQIGGVLHDLIMRRPLFAEFTDPYARLVMAVQNERPEIQNSAVPQHLIELASACLLKDPKIRARLVSWSSFEPPSAVATATGQSAKQRVTNRSILLQAGQTEARALKRDSSQNQRKEFVDLIIGHLKGAVRAIRSDNTVFPPLSCTRPLGEQPRLLVRFKASGDHGLPIGFSVFFNIDILDAAGRALALSAYAYTGTKPDTPMPFDPTIFFEGIFDTSSISTALERCIYEALDRAQESQSVGLASGAQGYWVNLASLEKN